MVEGARGCLELWGAFVGAAALTGCGGLATSSSDASVDTREAAAVLPMDAAWSVSVDSASEASVPLCRDAGLPLGEDAELPCIPCPTSPPDAGAPCTAQGPGSIVCEYDEVSGAGCTSLLASCQADTGWFVSVESTACPPPTASFPRLGTPCSDGASCGTVCGYNVVCRCGLWQRGPVAPCAPSP